MRGRRRARRSTRSRRRCDDILQNEPTITRKIRTLHIVRTQAALLLLLLLFASNLLHFLHLLHLTHAPFVAVALAKSGRDSPTIHIMSAM